MQLTTELKNTWNKKWEKGEIEKSTIILEVFNTPLSVISRTSRQEISKDIEDMNYSINELHLIYIYTLLYTTAE